MRLIERLHAIFAAEKMPLRPAAIAARRPAGTIASGFVDPRQREGTRRIALTLDQPTFERVRDRAARNNVSFAAAARQLIEAGAAKENC
ncbi:MAG: hypothetical protein ACREHV_01000 [Rhizomicrobium sp.]